MRVIAGTAKGRPLEAPPTSTTRPISDRAKESLFGILGPGLAGRSFCDLFAGSGGVGIEALSRGCAHATFVERSPRALACIRRNLVRTGLTARAVVVGGDVFRFLRGPAEPFGVIFAGPPQWRGLWTRAVLALDREPGWLASGGVVIAQHDPSESTTLDLRWLRLSSERTYGRVRFTFFRPPPGAP